MTMKECAFTKELIPLYKQKVLSTEATAAMEAHLSSCSSCRALLTENHSSQNGEYLVKTHFRKYHKLLRILKVCLILVLFLAMLLGYLGWKLVYGGLPDSTTSLADYGQWEEFHGYSGLIIFPETCSVNSRYRYYYQDQLNPKAEITLYSCYEAEEFYRELDRLRNLQVSDTRGHTNVIASDTEHFITEALVAEYNWRDCYEYALIFEQNHSILYVYLQNMATEELALHPAMLPLNYPETDEANRSCIYAFGYNGNLDSCVLIFE